MKTNGNEIMNYMKRIIEKEHQLIVKMSEGALNLNEIVLVVCLYGLLGDKQNTTSQLAKNLSMSPSAISNIVKKLEKKGYIKRVHDTIDRRKVYVFPQGKSDLVNKIYNKYYCDLDLCLQSTFSAEELDVFTNIMKSIESLIK